MRSKNLRSGATRIATELLRHERNMIGHSRTLVRHAQKLGSLPARRKALICEALLVLIQSAIIIHCRAFHRYAPSLGEPHQGDYAGEETLDGESLEQVDDVVWALNAVNRTGGGRFTCLMIGLAAKRLFNRRGIPNTLTLGVLPVPEPNRPMDAHAWVKVGKRVVTGHEGLAGHIAVVSYHASHLRKGDGQAA